MHLLFVYGTLKRGFPRDRVLRNSRYLGIAKTLPDYGMYAFRGYPALVDKNLALNSEVKSESYVFGELYEIDDHTISEVDIIESVEANLFKRASVNLDSITLTTLPTSQKTWDGIRNKIATAYFFQRDLRGAADCSPIWLN